jgi:hypothetical protein
MLHCATSLGEEFAGVPTRRVFVRLRRQTAGVEKEKKLLDR